MVSDKGSGEEDKKVSEMHDTEEKTKQQTCVLLKQHQLTKDFILNVTFSVERHFFRVFNF